MEVNLRSMMWHRAGLLCNVYLHFSQWQIAIGDEPEVYKQKYASVPTLVYMKHEISNLLARPGYVRILLKNRHFFLTKISFAVFNFCDPFPALADSIKLPRLVGGRWLKVLQDFFREK